MYKKLSLHKKDKNIDKEIEVYINKQIDKTRIVLQDLNLSHFVKEATLITKHYVTDNKVLLLKNRQKFLIGLITVLRSELSRRNDNESKGGGLQSNVNLIFITLLHLIITNLYRTYNEHIGQPYNNKTINVKHFKNWIVDGLDVRWFVEMIYSISYHAFSKKTIRKVLDSVLDSIKSIPSERNKK